jgi:hypothetical protein
LGVAFELVEKHWRLWRMGVDVPPQRVNGAVWREHMASLHHLSANVTRYYSLPLLAASVLWPSLLPATATLLLVSPTSDYRRLRPCLSMTVFIGLYWLEMAAYQVGVWRGCLKQRTLGPLIPMVCVRR